MIVELDFSQLEWRVAAQLSNDPVMIQEILDGVDIHESVRSDPNLFAGKVERVLAKVFNFRAIYVDERFAVHSFSSDPDMPRLSKRQWQRVISGFFEKYSRFSRWHNELYREVVINGGVMTAPSGRKYTFVKYHNNRGEYDYNRAQIYNYPVQGTAGGEILPIALVQLRRDFLGTPVKLINTVHDSIIMDAPKKELDFIYESWYNNLKQIPGIYREMFGVEWRVPLTGEMKFGPSWGEMETYHREGV